MNKQLPMKDKINKTFKSFVETYNASKNTCLKDVNLFNTIHLSENDHTNILWDILRYKQDNDYPFYESFKKEVLCIKDDIILNSRNIFNPEKKDIKQSGTQFKALANSKEKNNTNGWIDLLLNDYDNKSVVIIENKVCDASDGKNQLMRYYFSFTTPKENYKNILGKAYDKWKDKYREINYDNIFLVYLTKDGSKVPDTDSLPEDLKNELIKEQRYIAISYAYQAESNNKCILSWLKEDVLPNIKYNENGSFINSIKLYIEYIETKLLGIGQNYDIFNDVFKELDFNSCYKSARTTIGKKCIKEYNMDEEVKNEFKNCALYFAEERGKDKLKNASSWKIHCAGTFLMIYKEEWRKHETKKYTIPDFCLAVDNLGNFLENKKDGISWHFQFEHVGNELNNMQKGIKEKLINDFGFDEQHKSSNHDKTWSFYNKELCYGFDQIGELCKKFNGLKV